MVWLMAGRSGSYELSELDRSNLLFDLPIQPFVGTTLIDCTLIDCRQPNGFSIGSAFDAGALRAVTYSDIGEVTLDRAAQLGDIQPGLYGLTVADLVGANRAFTSTALVAFMAGNTTTLAQAEQDPALQLQGIPIQLLRCLRHGHDPRHPSALLGLAFDRLRRSRGRPRA